MRSRVGRMKVLQALFTAYAKLASEVMSPHKSFEDSASCLRMKRGQLGCMLADTWQGATIVTFKISLWACSGPNTVIAGLSHERVNVGPKVATNIPSPSSGCGLLHIHPQSQNMWPPLETGRRKGPSSLEQHPYWLQQGWQPCLKVEFSCSILLWYFPK